MEDLNKQIILRRLLNEFAEKLADAMTFNGIAKLFFECGIIDSPEKPYGVYPGSKYDYALKKLLASQNKVGFPQMLSSIQFDLCYSGNGPLIDDHSLTSLMKLLGYQAQNQNDPDWDPSLVAPSGLPKVGEEEKQITKRIIADNFPSVIKTLVNELNDNLDRHNLNASALLIRKTLTLACFIGLDKLRKKALIEDKELGEVLSIVQRELKIPSQVMARVKSAKWIGDSANHSYKVTINESDVEVAVTGLRVFLEEVLN
ncbi:MAG: hypothetical protein M1444_01230 [Patescibacteria group bacterium]|nr:hypothetical protein [Patescibacteria group bacterium]